MAAEHEARNDMSGARRPLIVVGGLLISAVALYLVIRSFDVGEAAEKWRRHPRWRWPCWSTS